MGIIRWWLENKYILILFALVLLACTYVYHNNERTKYERDEQWLAYLNKSQCICTGNDVYEELGLRNQTVTPQWNLKY